MDVEYRREGGTDEIGTQMDNKIFLTQLAKRLRCDNETVTRLVDGFGVILREQCGNAARVAVPGFGSFEGVKHPEEIVNDLATGKRMLLPPSIEVTFTSGSLLKKKLKEVKP